MKKEQFPLFNDCIEVRPSKLPIKRDDNAQNATGYLYNASEFPLKVHAQSMSKVPFDWNLNPEELCPVRVSKLLAIEPHGINLWEGVIEPRILLLW